MVNTLEVTGLNKSFGALKVTQDVTFALREGEALGVIGPNGAGKSTLFNLIAGVMRPDSGTIRLSGQDVTGISAMSRCQAGVGRTFQIPQPFQKLTVAENLLVACDFGCQSRIVGQADFCGQILEVTGLLRRANVRAGSLTLLERKRLELARALATDPRILLLDEIAGGLTDAECHELVGTIREIHSRGVAIVWIEHVLHALTSVVERLIVLNFGELVAEGAPDDVMSSRTVKEIYLGIEV